MSRAMADGFSLVVFTIAALAVLEGAACHDATRPSDDAETKAIIRLSEGLRLADEACAAVSLATHDGDLATRCADAYDAARAGILAVASVKDAHGDVRGTLCASASAAQTLVTILSNAHAATPEMLTAGIAGTQAAFSCTDGGK